MMLRAIPKKKVCSPITKSIQTLHIEYVETRCKKINRVLNGEIIWTNQTSKKNMLYAIPVYAISLGNPRNEKKWKVTIDSLINSIYNKY